eukprot:GFKZ01008997.1.p1 GENE.GFKZ01008997.1~~GFKZ01008997.1.p1  ORF type:complete len:123 (-),score=1.71 GFKZ01008997.1:466-834(-)
MQSLVDNRSIPSPSPPSVHDALNSPHRPTDIFDRILTSCIQDLSNLLILHFRAASHAWRDGAIHTAFLRVHLLPTAVLRRRLRGESCLCLCSSPRQHEALRDRIHRFNNEWGEIWTEAIQAH